MKQITFFLIALFCSFTSYSQECPDANDPCINYGAAFNAHNFVQAWALECGSSLDQDAVAVIDIFSNQVHQDLFGKVAGDSVVAISPLPPYLVCHHGVSVAGIVGAKPNNGMHIAGVGYNTKVALYNVGTGGCSSVGNMGDGVRRAVADGFKIINVSATWTGLSPTEALEFTNNGVVIVTAATSNSHSQIFNIPGVINCGGVRYNNDLGAFTYRDYAPGGGTDGIPDAGIDIFGYPKIERLTGFDACDPSNEGTSIVAPMVAGVVALMRSANPSLTPGEIECIIRMTGRSQVVANPNDPVPMDANPVLLDAEAAVQMAFNYDPLSFIGENVHLSGTQTISNIAVSGSLIIETGADITLDGVVNMGHNSNIIVNRGARLHIDGASVGPMECVSSWRGFRVVGNSFRPQPDENAALDPEDSGVLIINNNAQINNARKAVSMYNTHIVWDATSNYFGGLVIAEDASFNFNERSFEFMRYSDFEDNSRIVGCTFNDNTKNVMTLWRNNGVSIEGNLFDNYQRVAIYSLNAAYDVEGNNIFNGINNYANYHYAIQVNNTTISDRIPRIERNTINANGYGILLEGVLANVESPDGILIAGNSFQDVTFGIQVQGTNDYSIISNSILADDTGISCFASEDSEKRIAHNRMADGARGLAIQRDNDGLLFHENCFENLGGAFGGQTFGGGIELFEDDEILPTVFMLQANATENAVDNCFENVRDDIYTAISTSLPADHFTYLVDPDYPITDCRVPNVKHFINVEDALSDGQEPCVNPPVSPSGPSKSSNCTIPTSEVDIENSISQIENDIDDLLPIDSSDMTKRKEIYDLLQCLRRLEMELIRSFVRDDKEDQVEVRFGTEDDPYVRAYAYSHLVNTAHYAEALSYLNGVQDGRSEWQDFKTAQYINLRRLENFDSFTATVQEVDFLYNAGNRHTFYATWIRSIYTAVSGETIIFSLPSHRATPRDQANLSSDNESIISIFPNPAVDDIQISGLSLDLLYDVKICDITGKVVKKIGNISGNQKLNISNIANGVYILQVYNTDSRMIHALKIIKMR